MPTAEPLRWYERTSLVALTLAIVAFGALVEWRSAFQWDRKTDLDVYLRAAWACRTGRDPYSVSDDRRWHYVYPVPFAIAMTPLADPPNGEPRDGMPSFAVSVAAWYLLSVGCLFWATFALAGAIERAMGRAGAWGDRGSRSRWRLRMMPVWFAMPAIGSTLSRGQVNLLMLAFLALMIAAALDGKSFRAGLWLSAAICLKLIPAYLLIYPLWKRDAKWLAGSIVGGLFWFGVFPCVTIGLAATVNAHREFARTLLAPAIGQGDDTSRAEELTNMTATDSGSFVAVFHQWQYPNKATRPPEVSNFTKRAHWLVGGTLTLLTLLASARREARPLDPLLTLGGLCILMVLLSPVCHYHYFVVTVPVIAGLVGAEWNERPGPQSSWGLWVFLIGTVVIDSLPRLPWLTAIRTVGLGTFATLAIWGAGVWRMRRGEHERVVARVTRALAA